jgi:hypothetical protein
VAAAAPKPDVNKYLLDHRVFFNHGNAFELAASRAALNVDIEHAL